MPSFRAAGNRVQTAGRLGFISFSGKTNWQHSGAYSPFRAVGGAVSVKLAALLFAHYSVVSMCLALLCRSSK